MTKLPSAFVITVAVTFLLLSVDYFSFPVVHALGGSGSTIAVSYGTATVCAIQAAQPTTSIICQRRGDGASQLVPLQPNVSFTSIAGGRTSICAIRSGGYSLICWDTQNSSFPFKRIYNNNTVLLQSLAIGDEQICATTNGTPSVICWRGNRNIQLPDNRYKFDTISSGFGFCCGITADNGRIRCWGSNLIGKAIEQEFGDMSMVSLAAGSSHVCGVNSTGDIVCNGANDSGQLNVPSNAGLENAYGLALAEGYSCAIRRSNQTVVCWGRFAMNGTVSYEFIVSGSNFTCGLMSSNLSVACWGPGWVNVSNSETELPLPQILPGPCVQSSCSACGTFPDSDRLCSGLGNICNPCFKITTPPPPLPPLAPAPASTPKPSPSPPPGGLTRGLLAFAIVGSVGAFMGICSIIYCLWTGVCLGKKKVHNSVQPTITRGGSNGGATSNSSPPSRSLTIRRQSSRAMRRQRSGTSSKHPDKAEEFTLSELAAATNNFSLENKIGAGSFGVVYRGKLSDGREVAIKRGETVHKTKKFQEKESAFESELAFLSRLHHKHLVRLVGYCEERDERLLVYEFMKNGALYDHLHDKNNVEKSSGVLNSWKMRIKIALDAARGIEYLHNYAVPPVIHRDIKSSNILLDETWTARVSDFGLSLMGPEPDKDIRLMKAAGTVGYIDPEYYGLHVLTAKSDVYGLGVVMLELLTGKRAIFKQDEDEGTPVSLVDFAVPVIMAGELVTILDRRVGPPELNETEAVELMAYTAMHCVNLEGKDRPTMTDIVANLERALTICSDDSYGSISSPSISIVSE
ncbi:hypothetical protein SLEP1_g5891 [Rubroshorea leprosula]|uniref:non-specific serine/threonine protein kinase n=1 Tax=Rubroshorea leprosula TaxID=152421 RepID=A0AAV5HTE2_9ROSI|nr:hypothetical protein SLEP1_g5891 [Rubroshorea leprosula]